MWADGENGLGCTAGDLHYTLGLSNFTARYISAALNAHAHWEIYTRKFIDAQFLTGKNQETAQMSIVVKQKVNKFGYILIQEQK